MGGVIQGTHGGFDGDDDFRVGNSRGEVGVASATTQSHPGAVCGGTSIVGSLHQMMCVD